MSGVEYGDARRGRASSFPAEWGLPPGDAFSEERAAWVKSKVREHMAGTSTRQLRMKQLQMLVHLRQRLYEGDDNA